MTTRDDLPDSKNEWLPLMEYSMKKGISLSTLRRYIKSNKILYRVEGGRYLIFDESAGNKSQNFSSSSAHAASPLAEEIYQLRNQLQKAQEEIAELKTLIAFYETEAFTQTVPHA